MGTNNNSPAMVYACSRYFSNRHGSLLIEGGKEKCAVVESDSYNTRLVVYLATYDESRTMIVSMKSN